MHNSDTLGQTRWLEEKARLRCIVEVMLHVDITIQIRNNNMQIIIAISQMDSFVEMRISWNVGWTQNGILTPDCNSSLYSLMALK